VSREPGFRRRVWASLTGGDAFLCITDRFDQACEESTSTSIQLILGYLFLHINPRSLTELARFFFCSGFREAGSIGRRFVHVSFFLSSLPDWAGEEGLIPFISSVIYSVAKIDRTQQIDWMFVHSSGFLSASFLLLIPSICLLQPRRKDPQRRSSTTDLPREPYLQDYGLLESVCKGCRVRGSPFRFPTPRPFVCLSSLTFPIRLLSAYFQG